MTLWNNQIQIQMSKFVNIIHVGGAGPNFIKITSKKAGIFGGALKE